MKQVQHAIRWLTALVTQLDVASPGLQVTFRWRPDAANVLIQTDACPEGMGGFLMVAGRFVAYWHDAITEADLALLGATRNDPAFQSEWELLAVWISLEVFSQYLDRSLAGMRVVLRTDNTATIQAAMEYKASSPLMNQLAAEVSLQLAVKNLLPLFAQHVPGLLNDVADRLSRMSSSPQLPLQLVNCHRLKPPARCPGIFKAWPSQ